MSILLDIGHDLSKLYDTNGLIYREVPIDRMATKKDIFILIGDEGVKLIDTEIEDDLLSFHNKAKLIKTIDANKVLLSKGYYAKKSMSISPLGLVFKRDTMRKDTKRYSWSGDWHTTLNSILLDSYDFAIEETAEGTSVSTELVEELKEKYTKLLDEHIDRVVELVTVEEDVGGKDVVILFDADMEYFELFNKFFYGDMDKAFGSIDQIVEHEGETYGCSTFISLNAKKKFLKSSIYSDYDEIVDLKLVENMDYQGVRELISYNREVVSAIKREYIWEYDTKEVETSLKKNSYIGKSKKYTIGVIEVWHMVSYLEEKAKQSSGKDAKLPEFKKKLINEIFSGNISRIKVNKLKSMLMTEIIKDATLKLSAENMNIISNLNNILSADDEVIKIEGGVFNMEIIKRIQSGNISIENDREFSYLFGQVVYYVNSHGKEAKEKQTMGYLSKYLRKSDSRDLILKDMVKYKADIKRTKLLGNVIPAVMKYEIQNKLDQTMFLAGIMDVNVFYQKQTNESEEI